MGLRVSIYRSDYDSALNVFSGLKNVTVVNVDGPFDPMPDAPAARLSTNALGDPIIVPIDKPDGAIGPMMGGTFAHTSDSRFSAATKFYGAVAIHDRYEYR